LNQWMFEFENVFNGDKYRGVVVCAKQKFEAIKLMKGHYPQLKDKMLDPILIIGDKLFSCFDCGIFNMSYCLSQIKAPMECDALVRPMWRVQRGKNIGADFGPNGEIETALFDIEVDETHWMYDESENPERYLFVKPRPREEE